MVARMMDENNDITIFSFKSMMTESEDSYAIGMVHEMVVVLWVNNVTFQQVATKVHDENIIINVPHSFAFRTDDVADLEAHIDKYGYYCETADLFSSYPLEGCFNIDSLTCDTSTA